MMIFETINFSLIINSLVIAVSILSIVFSFGVVWRTEKELDISYKFFLGAIIVFTLEEFLNFFSLAEKPVFVIVGLFLKLFFSVLFLAGIFTARDLIRKMDGEKQSFENQGDV